MMWGEWFITSFFHINFLKMENRKRYELADTFDNFSSQISMKQLHLRRFQRTKGAQRKHQLSLQSDKIWKKGVSLILLSNSFINIVVAVSFVSGPYAVASAAKLVRFWHKPSPEMPPFQLATQEFSGFFIHYSFAGMFRFAQFNLRFNRIL